MAVFSKFSTSLVTILAAIQLAQAAVAELPITNLDGNTSAPTALATASDVPARTNLTSSIHDDILTAHHSHSTSTPSIHPQTTTLIEPCPTSTSSCVHNHTSTSNPYIYLAPNNGQTIKFPIPNDLEALLGSGSVYIAMPSYLNFVPSEHNDEFFKCSETKSSRVKSDASIYNCDVRNDEYNDERTVEASTAASTTTTSTPCRELRFSNATNTTPPSSTVNTSNSSSSSMPTHTTPWSESSSDSDSESDSSKTVQPTHKTANELSIFHPHTAATTLLTFTATALAPTSESAWTTTTAQTITPFLPSGSYITTVIAGPETTGVLPELTAIGYDY